MNKLILPGIIGIFFFMAGCATIPPNILMPSPDLMQQRQLESRKYMTTDETMVLSAVASVLQDVGFTLEKSETKLGFIAAYKQADAKDTGKIVTSVLVDVLFGSRTTGEQDKEQKVKASVIVKKSQDGTSTIVRITLQRIVWNLKGRISRVETLKDNEMYLVFFDKLSKSIFLEENQL